MRNTRKGYLERRPEETEGICLNISDHWLRLILKNQEHLQYTTTDVILDLLCEFFHFFTAEQCKKLEA